MNNEERLDDVAADWGVDRVLAAISEIDATAPADTVRAAVVEAVTAHPRAVTAPIAATELFARRVTALRSLLAQLGEADWNKQASPYSWSVHGLVAHLLVIERYTAAQFGIDDGTTLGADDDHLTMGAELIENEVNDAPGATVERWASAATEVVSFARSEAFHPDEPLTLHGWPFTATGALVARAFELWTHTDDIRRAVGLPREPISAEELRTMSSFSVASLTFLMPMVHGREQMAPTRVVLTGAGGGTYDIGGEGERAALVVADVVEYCGVVARRIDPRDLNATIEGDEVLAHALLDAARAFAV